MTLLVLFLLAFGMDVSALSSNAGEPLPPDHANRTLNEKEGRAAMNPPITGQGRQFWSFRPLTDTPSLPSPKHSEWANNEIDFFILAKLEAQKLEPNRGADRRKLIRRVYFDLIGLPPRPEEVKQFVDDTSADAYEKLVDRVLSNPHYGERWGRHWLDIARFAESHGYEQDYDRPNAYHYRDFVIAALNNDLPYDTFVKWQIAGDEIAPDNLEAMKATGFLAAGTHATQITANQAEKERYDELDDMVGTIGTAMLGLTIACARCHDHKFDPIPAHDYYSMISVFTTTVRSDYDVLVDPPKYRRLKAKFDQEHAPLVEALGKFEREQLPGNLVKWEQAGRRPALSTWLVLDDATAQSKGKAKFTGQEDGSFLVTGDNVDFDEFTFTVPLPVSGIKAVKLDALADPSLVKNGPGRAENGNFALSSLKLMVTPGGKTAKEATAVKFANARATFEQSGFPVSAAIDGDKKSSWAIDPQFGTNHSAIFELSKPLTNVAGSILTFTLAFNNFTKHAMGRPRLSVTTHSQAGFEDSSGPALVLEVNRILDVPPAERSKSQRDILQNWFRHEDPGWRALHDTVVAHAQKEPQPEKLKVLISSEGVPAVRLNTQGPDFYEKTYFLKRGDVNQKQEPAAPGYLHVLSRFASGDRWQVEKPSGAHSTFQRSALANWLTDTDAGAGSLLARVIVNRLWQHHFGRGIVSTPNDFGAQGEAPTHPQLLDWLAQELIKNNWRLKAIHKLILMSATYQQDNQTDARRAGIDPHNKLLWHRPPLRLEAEVIRDAILEVSERLDKRQFGPGSLDEAMRRRSLYFTIKRSKLVPMLMSFDAPDSLQGIGQRPSTTVAPQALLLMNNPQVRAAAAEFAKRLAEAEQGDADRIAAAYRCALSRPPETTELSDSLRFLQAQIDSYQSDGKETPRERALADFCQALLASNEFVYID